jgi:hypothetical protein
MGTIAKRDKLDEAVIIEQAVNAQVEGFDSQAFGDFYTSLLSIGLTKSPTAGYVRSSQLAQQEK